MTLNLTTLGSGAILTEVIQAAQQLAAQGVSVTVYSVTRWSELAPRRPRLPAAPPLLRL